MEIRELKKVMDKLSLAEKIGQLAQVTPNFFGNQGEITGPMSEWSMGMDQLYQVGSVLGTHRGTEVRKIQEDYLAHSQHQIPLMFMADVIHGYETIFPIPLALASSFDPELIEKVAKASAAEAASEGIQVTFSPMADYVKDPRWGRVLESNGEDPRLSRALTEAYVKGYQGKNLATESHRVAACVKHFVGYGAAEGGRDYNTVDFSDVELYQNYLPAFEGAIANGVKMVMTSFNSLHGVPVTGNRKLIKGILRDELGFDGVVISDWAAIAELMNHRVAENPREAAKKAFEATVDIDMMTDCYLNELAEMIETKEQLKKLDEAVWRILTLKNELGLFENPYRGLDVTVDLSELQELSYQAALNSAVLLKNNAVLPLESTEKILLIGTKATTQDVLGAWSWIGDSKKAISLASGLKQQFSEVQLISVTDQLDKKAIEQAIQVADKVIIAVGEKSEEAGEAASRAELKLKAIELELIDLLATYEIEKILVTFSGRPLVLTDVVEKVDAIVSAWFLGSQTGDALAMLLSGAENFTAHLPMSFPRSVGQLPYSYQEMSTGRPQTKENYHEKYISRYMDEENHPLYCFGHGLSYSEFQYKNFSLSSDTLTKEEELTVSFEVMNNSKIKGWALPQLYFQDEVTEVIRPKIELLKWTKVELAAGETKKVEFVVSPAELAYSHIDLKKTIESGVFRLFLGESVANIVAESRFLLT